MFLRPTSEAGSKPLCFSGKGAAPYFALLRQNRQTPLTLPRNLKAAKAIRAQHQPYRPNIKVISVSNRWVQLAQTPPMNRVLRVQLQ